jgi:hypothetical protein
MCMCVACLCALPLGDEIRHNFVSIEISERERALLVVVVVAEHAELTLILTVYTGLYVF